jgi:hypothetical protein
MPLYNRVFNAVRRNLNLLLHACSPARARSDMLADRGGAS